MLAAGCEGALGRGVPADGAGHGSPQPGLLSYLRPSETGADVPGVARTKEIHKHVREGSKSKAASGAQK